MRDFKSPPLNDIQRFSVTVAIDMKTERYKEAAAQFRLMISQSYRIF